MGHCARHAWASQIGSAAAQSIHRRGSILDSESAMLASRRHHRWTFSCSGRCSHLNTRKSNNDGDLSHVRIQYVETILIDSLNLNSPIYEERNELVHSRALLLCRTGIHYCFAHPRVVSQNVQEAPLGEVRSSKHRAPSSVKLCDQMCHALPCPLNGSTHGSQWLDDQLILRGRTCKFQPIRELVNRFRY